MVSLAYPHNPFANVPEINDGEWLGYAQCDEALRLLGNIATISDMGILSASTPLPSPCTSCHDSCILPPARILYCSSSHTLYLPPCRRCISACSVCSNEGFFLLRDTSSMAPSRYELLRSDSKGNVVEAPETPVVISDSSCVFEDDGCGLDSGTSRHVIARAMVHLDAMSWYYIFYLVCSKPRSSKSRNKRKRKRLKKAASADPQADSGSSQSVYELIRNAVWLRDEGLCLDRADVPGQIVVEDAREDVLGDVIAEEDKSVALSKLLHTSGFIPIWAGALGTISYIKQFSLAIHHHREIAARLKIATEASSNDTKRQLSEVIISNETRDSIPNPMPNLASDFTFSLCLGRAMLRVLETASPRWEIYYLIAQKAGKIPVWIAVEDCEDLTTEIEFFHYCALHRDFVERNGPMKVQECNKNTLHTTYLKNEHISLKIRHCFDKQLIRFILGKKQEDWSEMERIGLQISVNMIKSNAVSELLPFSTQDEDFDDEVSEGDPDAMIRKPDEERTTEFNLLHPIGSLRPEHARLKMHIRNLTYSYTLPDEVKCETCRDSHEECVFAAHGIEYTEKNPANLHIRLGCRGCQLRETSCSLVGRFQL